MLFIEKLEELIKAAKKNNQRRLAQAINEGQGPNEIDSQSLCEASKGALAGPQITGDAVMKYIQSCLGNPSINDELKKQRLKIVPPILLSLRMNTDPDLMQVIDEFAGPIVRKLIEEKTHAEEVFALVGGSLARLDISQGISGFDENEKALIKCGGIEDCGQDVQEKIRTYFKGNSHAETLSVEVYDTNDTEIYTVDVESDIFGEVKNVTLGNLVGAEEYTIKIRPKNQLFVLPKLTKFILSTAQPKTGGGFQAHLDLMYNRQFRYGNFDNSNDTIDKNDILAWAKLISENPELWNDSNLDGPLWSRPS